MSYSRWSYTNWYTFWNVGGGDTKDEQMLSVWYAGASNLLDLTFGQFGDGSDADFDAVVQYVLRHYEGQGCVLSDGDKERLASDLRDWVSDVQDSFP